MNSRPPNRTITLRVIFATMAAVCCWLSIYRYDPELFAGVGLVGAVAIWCFFRATAANSMAAWHERTLAAAAFIGGLALIVNAVRW